MRTSLFKIPPSTLAKTDGTDYFYKVYQSTVFKIKNCILFYVTKFLLFPLIGFGSLSPEQECAGSGSGIWLVGNSST
jgi:hypothetical protein